MATDAEGTINVEGKTLYTRTFLPEGAIKAKLVFVHGFSDHIGRYYDLFPSLARRGIAVYGFDQRGWGRSVAKPAEKGLTGPTARVLADIAAVATPHLPSSPSDPPLFIAGHSMGGGEVLCLASDPTHEALVSKVRGWLLDAPYISLTPEAQPWSVTVAAGRLMGKLLPKHHMVNRIPPETVTRDAAVAKSLEADDLCHNTGTLEGLAGMLDRSASLTAGRARPGKAVRALWLAHGTADKVTSFAASRKYFDECCGAVQDKQFRAFDGFYHQLHADGPESGVFHREFGDWILARAGREDQQDAKL